MAREFCHARDRKLTACEKSLSREARNRFGPRKGQGWGLSFFLPLRQFAVRRVGKGAERRAHAVLPSRPNLVGFASLSTTLQKLKEAERRQTPGSLLLFGGAARSRFPLGSLPALVLHSAAIESHAGIVVEWEGVSMSL